MVTALGSCVKWTSVELKGGRVVIGPMNKKMEGGWVDLGKPTQTLVPCWMPKPLLLRNQCTGWFAPAGWTVLGFANTSGIVK